MDLFERRLASEWADDLDMSQIICSEQRGKYSSLIKITISLYKTPF